jgi:ribosome-associated protein
MSLSPYVRKEIDGIFEANTEYPKNAALAACWILANYKGINIKAFNVTESSSLCDYNVIASAQNIMQARTMIEEISANLKRKNCEVISVEGMEEGEWILCDLGDIIVHVFQEVSREIFNLDELWMQYPQLEIPQEYYFGNADNMATEAKEDSTDNYF